MKKIFSLLAAVLFAGSMMADPIVINASDVTTIASGATSGLDVTLQGINIVWQGAYYNSDGGDGGSASVDFRVYANKSMTLTAESNISKVEIAGYCKAGLTVTANAGTITTGASYASETTKGTLEDPLIVVDEIGATSVTLTCTKQVRAYTIRVTLGEGGDVEPTMAYYVAGSMTNWGPMAAYKLAPNPANEGEYMGEFTFAANDEFKVGYSDGTTIESTNYFPSGMDNNYVINEAGDYTVYFRPDGQGGEGWHYGVIYAAKKEAPADPTNCAEAAAAALSVENNNDLYNNGAVYTITGYVTGIKTAYNDNFHNISFWMADAADGGEVLQAYRAACASEADAPVVGDKVAVTGSLTKYNTTPEFAAGCTFEIIEHAAPTTAYYLVGTNNGWNGAGYQFAANPAAEGEYMLDVTFAANDEFKVIGVLESDTTWFPAEANNCTINEEGLYTVYFRPDYQGGQDWYAGCIYNVKKEAPIVHQYEVAEAIAAGLADDTEIMVRGVVTKIEFKGKNFAKYGSANIYVADATGAEGAFEFYNCYSLDADTFRTSSPEYDAESTAWAEFDMVADENGNEVHVGDTIIAFGKYKLYNTTHELNTGCYIVDVIPGEGGGEETIGYDYEPTEASQFSVVIDSIKVEDYTADLGVVVLGLEDAEGVYFAYLEYLTSTYDEKVGIPAGTYQISNSEAEGTFYASPGGDEEYDYGCYFGVIDGDYYTPYYMVSGTVTIYTDGSMLVNATSYFGSTIKLVYGNPVEAVENTKVADNKVIKFIEAGKVVIRKNGVKYNVVGQMMK